MSVKFCFASGYFPARVGDLELLPYKDKTYTNEQIRARMEKAMSLSDDVKYVWRHRIICILGLFKTVFCINFIPADPHRSQILQVMRMKNLEETADSYPVYDYEFSQYKCILPEERPDQIFDLSEWDFCHLDPTVKDSNRAISLALYCLAKEKALRGMALTLQGVQGDFKTYMWLKPTYKKYTALRHGCRLAG